MAEIGCRHFNGYKPCGKNTNCDRSRCASYSSVQERILIVHLEAFGAVLRSTSLLAAIKRKYPRSHVTWATKSPAAHLLANNELIDRVVTDPYLALSALRFDLAFVIDKSLEASGVLARTHANEVRGFRADPLSGAILPANPEAKELWNLGLNDHLKFKVNQKTEQRLVHEALALGPYLRDEYDYRLTPAEKDLAQERREQWSPLNSPVIGLNTGCAPTLKAKKLTVEGHRELIGLIRQDPTLKDLPIVLLGGPEDAERNREIGQGLDVHLSPFDKGMRDGMASVHACDLIFSGDSLGLHMAIAQRKWTVAWFGPSCAQEIDLYERGRKVLTKAPCSPCWKRVCGQKVMCYDQVDFIEVLNGLKEGLSWLTSSSKPLFRETSFSPSL
jgi:heptosyltransferase-2